MNNASYRITPPRTYTMQTQRGKTKVVEIDGSLVADAAIQAKAGEKKKAPWVEYAMTRKSDGK